MSDPFANGFSRAMDAARAKVNAQEWEAMLPRDRTAAVYHEMCKLDSRCPRTGTAAMLIQVSPLLIALLASVFLGEAFTAPLAVGLLLAFAGVAVIGLSTSPGGERAHYDPWHVIVHC